MQKQEKERSEQQQSTNTSYDTLTQNIQTLKKQLDRLQNTRKEKQLKRKEQLNDLYDAMEEKSNAVVSKLQDLTRKPTIIISVTKILPQIPEGFPKNYNIQIVYEDVTVTGNQKFIDFDENIIDERFILPLLSSQTAKLEVWIAEEQPSLYDRCVINLQADIEAALDDPNFTNQVELESNPTLSMSYKVQLQGIGFNSWLKNLRTIRQAQQQRKKARRQTQLKQSNNRQKIVEKKREFYNKFAEKQATASKTKEYNLKDIEDILNSLND